MCVPPISISLFYFLFLVYVVVFKFVSLHFLSTVVTGHSLTLFSLFSLGRFVPRPS